MSLAGSGRAAVDSLNADSAHVSIDGSGSVTAAGRIDSLDVSVAGSGRLSAAKLESQKAKVAVAGSGRATLWATDALDASVLASRSALEIVVREPGTVETVLMPWQRDLLGR